MRRLMMLSSTIRTLIGGTEPSSILDTFGSAGLVPYGSACGAGLLRFLIAFSGVGFRVLRGRDERCPCADPGAALEGVGGVEFLAASGAGGVGSGGADAGTPFVW